MRLSPRDFWALSLAEWRALCEAHFPSGAAMSSAALDRLLQEHPDHG